MFSWNFENREEKETWKLISLAREEKTKRTLWGFLEIETLVKVCLEHMTKNLTLIRVHKCGIWAMTSLLRLLVISAPLTICGYPNFPWQIVAFSGKIPNFSLKLLLLVLETEPPVLLQYQFFKWLNVWNCKQVQWKSIAVKFCETTEFSFLCYTWTAVPIQVVI